MPQLNDATQALLSGEVAVKAKAKSFWKKFCDFAFEDNVLEIAFGLIVASAFTEVVNSFVADMVVPIVSLLPFIDKQLDEKFAVLRAGPHYNEGKQEGYNTLKQAIDDGAIVFAWGAFLRKIMNFISVALTLYFLAMTYTYFSKETVIKEKVKCKYCRKKISIKATRCFNCTSWQDGRETP